MSENYYQIIFLITKLKVKLIKNPKSNINVSKVQSGPVRSSVVRIANNFINGAWAIPASDFISA